MSINPTVALVQKLRLSLQPVFQIMTRQTPARFEDRTGARCDLFLGWPGLGLLGSRGFGLVSVFLIFHVLAVGCALARGSLALAKTMPTPDGTGQTFNCNNFSASQGMARGFDCKASMLNCKCSWQLAAVNRTGSETESVFPVANEEFSGTPRLNPAMGMGYAFSRRHGSDGWFLWPVTLTCVKIFYQS